MTQRVVNYTYGTGNPVLPNGSIDVRDGIDNLQSFDVFMNASEDTYNQRDGEIVRTVAGINKSFDEQILNMGFARAGTFGIGATITNPRQTLLWDVADGGDGQEYGWSGSFPKVVPAGSTPLTTGGIAVGAWMSRFDPELRTQVREALRRSYAEAGYALVAGSFEAGGTLTSASDVLLHEASGKAYGWEGAFPKVVAAGSTVTGFVDKSGVTQSPNVVLYFATVDEMAAAIGYNEQVAITTSYRGFARGGASYKWVAGSTSNENLVTVFGNSSFGRWHMLHNGFVYDSQCGVLPMSCDTSDQSQYYQRGLDSVPKVISVYADPSDPIHVVSITVADKALIGVKIPFRNTGETGTKFISPSNFDSPIRFARYKLGQQVENLIIETTATTGPTRPAIEVNPNNEVNTAGIGARISNVVAKGNWLCGARVGGTSNTGWSWEILFDNFQAEGYKSSAIEVGGFAANVSIRNCKGLLGDIPSGAVALRIKSGNVRIDNFRSENNTWTLDLVGGHVSFNNLYSEGNRNGDIRAQNGSCIGDFMQAAHTNTGVTTEAIIKVVSGTTAKPVVKVGQIAISVANGNVLSYLTLLESDCHCECDFLWGSGVDTSGVNFLNVSAEFNPRFAPNRLGFPQQGFELRRAEVQGMSPYAFTAHKLTPRGFFDANLQFKLPRIDAGGNPAEDFNATRRYSTYATSACVDYVNTSTTPSSPTWVKRSTLQ